MPQGRRRRRGRRVRFIIVAVERQGTDGDMPEDGPGLTDPCDCINSQINLAEQRLDQNDHLPPHLPCYPTMSTNNRRGGRASCRGGSSSRGGGSSWRSGPSPTNSIAQTGEPQYVSKKFTASNATRSEDSSPARGRGVRGGGRLRIPGPSRMDLMASVSRSSGLEKGGDE